MSARKSNKLGIQIFVVYVKRLVEYALDRSPRRHMAFRKRLDYSVKIDVRVCNYILDDTRRDRKMLFRLAITKPTDVIEYEFANIVMHRHTDFL